MKPFTQTTTAENTNTKKTTFTRLAIATTIAIATATALLALYLPHADRKKTSINDNEEINSSDYNYVNSILKHSNCPQAHSTAINAINSRGMITQGELKQVQEQLEACRKNTAKEELRQNIGRQHTNKDDTSMTPSQQPKKENDEHTKPRF